MSFGLNPPPPSTAADQSLIPEKSGAEYKIVEADRNIDRLRTTLPKKPYLLRLDSIPPYRLTEEQRRQWTAGTPFGPGEEELQYMTYIHRDPSETLCEVIEDWEVPDTTKLQQNGSKAGPTKKIKKITLDAYRNRRKNGALNASGTRNSASDSDRGVGVAPSAPSSQGGNSDVCPTNDAKPDTSGLTGLHGEKRTLDAMNGSRSLDSHTTPGPAPKKARTTPPATPASPPPQPRLPDPTSQSRKRSPAHLSTSDTREAPVSKKARLTPPPAHKPEQPLKKRSSEHLSTLDIDEAPAAKKARLTPPPAHKPTSPSKNRSPAVSKIAEAQKGRDARRPRQSCSPLDRTKEGGNQGKIPVQGPPASHSLTDPLTEPTESTKESSRLTRQISDISRVDAVPPPSSRDAVLQNLASFIKKHQTSKRYVETPELPHSSSSSSSLLPRHKTTASKSEQSTGEVELSNKLELDGRGSRMLPPMLSPTLPPKVEEALAKYLAEQESVKNNAGRVQLEASPPGPIPTINQGSSDEISISGITSSSGTDSASRNNNKRAQHPATVAGKTPRKSSDGNRPASGVTESSSEKEGRRPPTISHPASASTSASESKTDPKLTPDQKGLKRVNQNTGTTAGATAFFKSLNGGNKPVAPRRASAVTESNSEKEGRRPLTVSRPASASTSASESKTKSKSTLSQEGLKPKPNPVNKGAGATSFFQSLNSGNKPVAPVDRRQLVAKAETTQKKVIKLAYGKTNQKRVQQLLKSKPTPAGTTNTGRIKRAKEDETADDTIKVAQARGKEAVKLTPDARVATRSRDNERVRSLLSTPTKDGKGVAMRRMESSESHVATPQGPKDDVNAVMARGATSVGEKTDRESRPTSANDDLNTRKESDMWKAEYNKYTAIGRRIKYQAEGLLVPKSSNGSKERRVSAEGAALAIQSVCCYMLAFTALDESRARQNQAGDVSSWRTLIGLLNFAGSHCQPFKPLHGLCMQLTAICREMIRAIDPADTTATTSPSNTINRPEEIRRLWLDGTSELNIDDIQSIFPRTWSKRSEVPLAMALRKMKERLSPANYYKAGARGGFYLPMSSVTTPVEAVRVTASMLQEWSTEKRIEGWKDSIGVLTD